MVKKLECMISMQFTGGSFVMHQVVNKEIKGDFDAMKDARLTAFAMNSLATYAQFVKCHLRPEEPMDVFLANLKRISVPFGGMMNQGLKAAMGCPNSFCMHLLECKRWTFPNF